MKIEFTDQEAQVTVNLIDSAIRAGGYRVAPAACSIVDKFVAAAQEAGTQLQSEAGPPPTDANGAPVAQTQPAAQAQPAAPVAAG